MLEDKPKTQYEIDKGKQLDRYHSLVKRVFNSDEGRELMQIWADANDLIAIAQPGMGLLEIGLEQGERNFTRKLKLILKRESE